MNRCTKHFTKLTLHQATGGDLGTTKMNDFCLLPSADVRLPAQGSGVPGPNPGAMLQD